MFVYDTTCVHFCNIEFIGFNSTSSSISFSLQRRRSGAFKSWITFYLPHQQLNCYYSFSQSIKASSSFIFPFVTTKAHHVLTAWPPSPLQGEGTRMRFYSVLKLFTGLDNAALIAWKLTVINAITIAAIPAITNTHKLILIR